MSEIKHGGPAFPGPDQAEQSVDINEGMTLLDYFIAHAPAEPQPWFRPAMEPEPKPTQFPTDMTQEERDEYHGWGEFLGTEDLKCPRVRTYAESVDAYTKLRRARDSEYEKQRYVQWPGAWANEMLRVRGEA